MTTTQFKGIKNSLAAMEQIATEAFASYLFRHAGLVNPVMVMAHNGVALWRGIKPPAGVEWWVILDRSGELIDGGSVGSVALKIWRETVAT